MKKTICLIGMLLCLCVIGSAFAIAYYDAEDKSGTVTADSYLRLTLGGSTTNELVLEEDIPSYYTIEAKIDHSAMAANETVYGEVTITLGNSENSNNSADNIKISVFTDSNCTTSLKKTVNNEQVPVTQTGAGSIVISDIQDTTNYYLTVEIIPKVVEGEKVRYSPTELAAISGVMNISFVRNIPGQQG